jgi:ribosome-binding factor A
MLACRYRRGPPDERPIRPDTAMPSTRQRRVQEMLVHEVAEILRREIQDPRIGFVTITDAEVSPDLRHARIFFSVLGEPEKREETTKALNRAAGFVRSEFARRAQMRYVPDIRFQFDSSVERGARIHELLAQVKEANESLPADPDAADGDDDPGEE